jgi:hypothetical protein
MRTLFAASIIAIIAGAGSARAEEPTNAVDCVIEANDWIQAEIDANFGKREIQDNYKRHLQECSAKLKH